MAIDKVMSVPWDNIASMVSTTKDHVGAVAGQEPTPPSGGIDSYTKLMLHADGSGSSFVDSSASTHTLTPVGDITQSSTESKFGGTSLYSSGSSSNLETEVTEDVNFGTGDFTIDYWMKSTDQTSLYTGQLANNRHINNDTGPWRIWNRGWYANNISFHWGQYAAGNIGYSADVNDGVWHHVAVVRYNGVMSLYVDGDLKTSDAGAYSAVACGQTGSTGLVCLQLADTVPYQGYLDEIRISKGIARWTSNFVPPVSAYS